MSSLHSPSHLAPSQQRSPFLLEVARRAGYVLLIIIRMTTMMMMMTTMMTTMSMKMMLRCKSYVLVKVVIIKYDDANKDWTS